MQVLVIEVGKCNVKVLVSRQDSAKKAAATWNYEVVSMGYPGLVLRHRAVTEPAGLGRGCVGFDFEAAFGCPVEVINDTAVQALGRYKGGQVLFLRLETNLGSALVANDNVIPVVLGHLSYKNGTFEDYVGLQGIQWPGKKKWRRHVALGVASPIAALHADDVVVGGHNAKKLKQLPAGCRAYDDASAFLGGYRLWDHFGNRQPRSYVRLGQDNHGSRKDKGNGSTHTSYHEAPPN